MHPFITSINIDAQKSLYTLSVLCEFNSAYYQDDLFAQANINFPSTLKKAVTKRKAEFLAGRYMAKIALLELKANSYHVPIGENRNPLWPHQFIGSITHTHNRCICTVALPNKYKGLGIDLENFLSCSTVNEIKNRIISLNEYRLLDDKLNNDIISLTLAFSLKESLFKSLYPSIGYYFDFSAAEVTNIDLITNTVSLLLTETLSSHYKKGHQFRGNFYVNEASIFTSVLF